MTYGQYQIDQEDHHDHDQIHETELFKEMKYYPHQMLYRFRIIN